MPHSNADWNKAVYTPHKAGVSILAARRRPLSRARTDLPVQDFATAVHFQAHEISEINIIT